MTLRASEHAAPYPLRFAREAALDARRPAAAQRVPCRRNPANAGRPADAGFAGEPACGRTIEPNWPRIWRSYRFVAAMMGAGTTSPNTVAPARLERGWSCSSSRKMTLFDPSAAVVGDLQWRFQDDWRFEARLHDIVSTPLSRQVDSAYCVDFMQYISRDEEDDFLRNLRDLLSRDCDFLLIGSPSYGAATPARSSAARSALPIDELISTAEPLDQRSSVARGLPSNDLSAHRHGAESPDGALFSKCIRCSRWSTAWLSRAFSRMPSTSSR